jgi:Transposase DDE domain
MVERSIAWLVAKGHRRVRHRGLARNQLGLSLRVAAINLRRAIAMGLDHHDAGRCWPEEAFSGPGVSMRDVSTA